MAGKTTVSDPRAVPAVIAALGVGDDDYVLDGYALTVQGKTDEEVETALSAMNAQGAVLVEAKRSKVAAIKAEYARRLSPGFTYQGHAYQADREAIDNATSVAAGLANGFGLPSPWQGWRAADNAFVPMTQAEFLAFAVALRDRVAALRAALWAHVDALRALGTVAAVEAYDVASGWPEGAPA